jgi:hypothetical protein
MRWRSRRPAVEMERKAYEEVLHKLQVELSWLRAGQRRQGSGSSYRWRVAMLPSA